ncbi:alpha/beta fold hydrolase [Paenibacillus tarimensis]
MPGERLYKSGDLAKRLPGGELAYMGRIDHQVKIRGHRIELAEVEAVLLRHEAVQEAVVLARDDGDGQPYLCAYYTAASGESDASLSQQASEVSELRNYLKAAVPDYMIPSYFVPLAAIPMTGNGKVDRKALPAPQGHVLTGTPYAAPRSEVEVVLAGIWQDVLGISRAGIDDHFFESGGHSLKAMALSDEISRVLGISLPLQEVFLRPTIRELAACIELHRVREDQHDKHQHLVLLKKGKDQNRHIFMIHGGSGDVTVYVPLVNLLQDNANYWGIQLPTWEQPSPKRLSIEELAASYAGYMAEIQPHGPYIIVGMSLGGTIGYEVARLLEARGQQVERLILIDSHAPAAADTAVVEFSLETELELAGDLLSRMDGVDVLTETGLMGSCRTMEEVWNHVIQTVEQHERRDELLAGIKLLADEDIRQTIPQFDQLSLGKLLPYVHLIRSLTAALTRYSLQPLQHCTPDLIIASASADLEAARWCAGGRGHVRTYSAEGDHYSIFTAPYVAGLAAIMQELIQNKEAAGQPV